MYRLVLGKNNRFSGLTGRTINYGVTDIGSTGTAYIMVGGLFFGLVRNIVHFEVHDHSMHSVEL